MIGRRRARPPHTRYAGSVVRPPAIVRRLVSLAQAVVADHARDPQPIVPEDPGAALRLGGAMGGQVAPSPHGVLVAPERERQELSSLAQALEALHRDEPVDPLEIGSKRGGEIEIVPGLALRGPDLEDDRDHGLLDPSCGEK